MTLFWQSYMLLVLFSCTEHPNVENEVKGIKHQLQKSVNIPPAQYSRIDEVPSEMTTEGQADIENSGEYAAIQVTRNSVIFVIIL